MRKARKIKKIRSFSEKVSTCKESLRVSCKIALLFSSKHRSFTEQSWLKTQISKQMPKKSAIFAVFSTCSQKAVLWVAEKRQNRDFFEKIHGFLQDFIEKTHF